MHYVPNNNIMLLNKCLIKSVVFFKSCLSCVDTDLYTLLSRPRLRYLNTIISSNKQHHATTKYKYFLIKKSSDNRNTQLSKQIRKCYNLLECIDGQ